MHRESGWWSLLEALSGGAVNAIQMEKINVAIRVRPPSDASSPVPFLKGQKWNVGPQNISLYSGLGTPVKGQSYSFGALTVLPVANNNASIDACDRAL